MSRHRDFRRFDIDNEMSDDVYGRSVEDEYAVSPGTASQYHYKGNEEERFLFSFISTPQGSSSKKKRHKSDDKNAQPLGEAMKPPVFDDIDVEDEERVLLENGKEYIISVVGSEFSEEDIVEALQRCDLSAEIALNELLTQRTIKSPMAKPKNFPLISFAPPGATSTKDSHSANTHISSLQSHVPISISNSVSVRGNETDRNVVSKRMDSKQVQETSHPPEQQKSQFAPQEAFQSMLQPGASTKGSVLLGSECEKFDSPPTGPTHSSPSLSDLIRQSEVSDVSNKPRTSPSEFTGISFTRPRPAESSTPPSLGDLIRQKHVSETNSTVLARPQVPPTEGSNNQPKSSMPSLSDLIGSRHSVMPPSLTTSSSDSTDFSSVLDESKGRLSSGSVSRQHVGGAANAKIQLKSLTRGSPGTSPSLAELMTSSKGMCSSDTGSTLPNKPRGNQGKVGAERTPGITPSLADLIRESTGSGRNQEGTKVPSEEVRGSGGNKVASAEVRGSGGDKVPSAEVRGSGGNKIPRKEVRGSGGDKVPRKEVRGSGGDEVQTSIYQHPLEHKVNSKREESHGTSLSLVDLMSKEVSDIDQTGKVCTHPRLSDLMVLDKESTGGQTGKETTPPSLEDLMQKRPHQSSQSPHLRGLNVMQSPVAAPSLADLMSKNVESKAGLSHVSPSPHPPATVKGRIPITEPLSARNHAPHTPAPTLVDLMRSSGTSSGDQIMKEKGPYSLTDLMGVKTTQSDRTFLGSTPSSATIRNTTMSSAPLSPLHHHHHDMATLFGAQRNVGNKSAHSEVHSVVLLQPNNASPTALVVSRKCNSISDRHRSIEAAILKSFCKDWYGGKLWPFSFTTPSPDDVVHNRQKGHIK